MAIWLCTFILGISASEVNTGSLPLTVMTYNIHHGSGTDNVLDLDRIVAIIREQAPDVVCLQEVDRNLPRTGKMDMPAVLSEKLGMTCIFESNYNFDGGEYGNATLTRLPVVASRNIALPNPMTQEPRGCLATTVEWQGRKIVVMNTHLGLKGQERLAQAEAIVQELGDEPVILAGDMNETLTAPALQVFRSRLRDTMIKENDSTPGTVPSDTPRRRIDYILVSEQFETISSLIIRNDATRVASDHLPYAAVLSLR